MPLTAPNRPKTAYELKRRAVVIHGTRQVPTFTEFCYSPKLNSKPGQEGYEYFARVVKAPAGYKWIEVPDATFLPAPDLRDWHISGARIFVLDAEDLDLTLTCTHKHKVTNEVWCHSSAKTLGWC